MKRLTGSSLGHASLGFLLCAGCSGPQSALDPAGDHAEHLAALFWWMCAGSLLLWAVVMTIALHAAYAPERRDLSGPRRLIIYGGVVVPSVLLTGLLIYGLTLLPRMLAPVPEARVRILVEGRQWWWRVRYFEQGESGAAFELANEIRLPVGEPVEFVLESHDVIHSFWIPSLAGKVDMIPGRRTRLSVLPKRVGELRGACAEFCGASHAFMAFPVVVEEQAVFDRWREAQRRRAREPVTALERRGLEAFLDNGCGACHTVRGTGADGRVGPDLTHVGGRRSIAAGSLPASAASFERWVTHTEGLKPEVHMPAFGMLEPRELDALGAYLESLK